MGRNRQPSRGTRSHGDGKNLVSFGLGLFCGIPPDVEILSDGFRPFFSKTFVVIVVSWMSVVYYIKPPGLELPQALSGLIDVRDRN